MSYMEVIYIRIFSILFEIFHQEKWLILTNRDWTWFREIRKTS